MPRNGWSVALVLSSVAFLATACDVGPAMMSDNMQQSLLPSIGASAGFENVQDWRRLDRPTAELRSFFEAADATYQVISAERDQADLAIWETGEPEGEPFNAKSGCHGHRVRVAAPRVRFGHLAGDGMPFAAARGGALFRGRIMGP